MGGWSKNENLGPCTKLNLVFVFLAFWGSTEYVYEIWLSLVKRARTFIFDLPPILGDYFQIFLSKTVKNYIHYNFASNGICRRVNSLGVIINEVILRYFSTPSGVDYSKKRLYLASKNLTFVTCAEYRIPMLFGF